MLKLLNLSKLRINQAYRQITTSSVKWQGGELTKSRLQDDAIRAIEKKAQRLPLVKNFFVGIVDTELIAYPEAIYEIEQHQLTQQRKKSYEDFLETNIFVNPDDVNNVNKLKEFGCFRNTSSLMTEKLFSVSECEAKFLSYSTFLNNHQQVLRLIKEFGDEDQKLKYLPQLEAGDLIATPCLFEIKRPAKNNKAFNTEAVFKDGTGEWILNGEKSFVLTSPAHKSSLFLVIASNESKDLVGDYKDGITALLVDSSLPGVSVISEETIGFGEKAFSQVTVSFKNVMLNSSNVLGDDGIIVAQPLLTLSRLDKGVQALGGIMKPLIKQLTSHCINTKVQGVQLKDIDTIKEQLGSLACNYYALESMIYMTAGLSDIYNKQDIEVESAMVQAFAIQAMTDFIVRPLHAVGPQAAIKRGGFDRFIRDAIQLAASGEQLDGIKQFIALAGMNHAGQILNEVVKKERNPLNHPAFVFSRIFKQTSIQNPKKKFHLDGFLHPSLDPAANFLESSILRLNAAAEILLARHGSLVVEHSVEVARLAEAAILCYAMFASVARASRSYCIGLRNAEQEIHLTSFFCYDGAAKVKEIALDIDKGEYGTSEHTFKLVGEKLIESNEYHLVHPTTRNF